MFKGLLTCTMNTVDRRSKSATTSVEEFVMSLE